MARLALRRSAVSASPGPRRLDPGRDAEAAAHASSPCTRAGTAEKGVVVPLPSWPNSPLPQQNTPPVAAAQQPSLPPTRLVTPRRRCTACAVLGALGARPVAELAIGVAPPALGAPRSRRAPRPDQLHSSGETLHGDRSLDNARRGAVTEAAVGADHPALRPTRAEQVAVAPDVARHRRRPAHARDGGRRRRDGHPATSPSSPSSSWPQQRTDPPSTTAQ